MRRMQRNEALTVFYVLGNAKVGAEKATLKYETPHCELGHTFLR
jgi:hypothetical protein